MSPSHPQLCIVTQKILIPGSKWLIAASVQLHARSACSIIHRYAASWQEALLVPEV